jgi:hypothetical protein
MAVRYDIKTPDDDFEIYDVVRDPKEASDLAAQPGGAALQARFKALAMRARRPSAQAPRPYDDALVPAPAAPADATPAPADAKLAAGLAWHYYEGDFAWVPDCAGLRALKSGVSANGLALENTPLRAGQNAAILYEGCLRVPADGEYVFEAKTDTGMILRLHEATVIDADHGYKPGDVRSAAIRLQAGLHPFTLVYRSDGNPAPSLSLTWRGPDLPAQDIAPSSFQH